MSNNNDWQERFDAARRRHNDAMDFATDAQDYAAGHFGGDDFMGARVFIEEAQRHTHDIHEALGEIAELLREREGAE